MVDLTFFGLILLFCAPIAVGVVAGVVHTWALRARVYSLETRLATVEGTLTHEVKVRAGQERWKKSSKADDALAAALIAQHAPPAPKLNWWENPALKKGAHVS